MKKLMIALSLLLILLISAGCDSGKKIEFRTVVLPFYGYNDYGNLKTLHVVSIANPKMVDFSFDDNDLVILVKGLDGKYTISDFKYTNYAVLYLSYGMGVKKLTITKAKGNYYINGNKYINAREVIKKILKLKQI